MAEAPEAADAFAFGPRAEGGGSSSNAAAKSMREGTRWSKEAVEDVRTAVASKVSGLRANRLPAALASHGELAAHWRSSKASLTVERR